MAYTLGSTGSDVLRLQQTINSANKGKSGYVPLAEDGQYGPLTQAAHNAYQASSIPVVTTPIPTTTPTDISGLTSLKDYASGKGLNVGWDPNAGAMINNQKIDTSGLVNSGGHLYGNLDQLNGLVVPFTNTTTKSASPAQSTTVNNSPVATPVIDSSGNYKMTMPDGTAVNVLPGQLDWALGQGFKNTGAPASANTSTTASTNGTPISADGFKSVFDDPLKKAMLDKYLNPTPFSYDPKNDPNYGIAQREGQKVFNNQIGDLTAVTGGRLNSWASSAASQAQDNYMGNQMAQMENSAYDKYQNQYQDLGRQLNLLQGMDATNYGRYQDANQQKLAADQQKVKDFQATINQYYPDVTAQINKVRDDGDPSNDWQLPYLNSFREDKKQTIANNTAALEANAAKDKTAAAKEAWNNELAMWKAEGVASKDYPHLGIKAGTKTADYSIASLNAQTAAAKTSNAADKPPSTTELNGNYQKVKTEYSKATPDEMYDEITNYADDITALVGPTNYNKLIQDNQKMFYDKLVQDLSHGPAIGTDAASASDEAALDSLDRNSEFWKSRLGDANFNKIYASVQSKVIISQKAKAAALAAEEKKNASDFKTP
jgi:hypothetical protein